MQRDPITGSASLTPRERQIVFLNGEGLSDKEIAAKLKIKVPTVRTFWDRIRTKIGVHGRSEATAVVARGELQATEADHLKLVSELRQQILADEVRFVSLGELLDSLIWVTDSDLRLRARYGPEQPAPRWTKGIRVGAFVGDAFKPSRHGKAVVAAHRRAMAGAHSTVELFGVDGGMDILVGPLKDGTGTIVGCVGVMKLGRAGMEPAASDAGRAGS